MTLIASFKVGKYAFMLGDLLLSGPVQASQPPHLPSIGDVPQTFLQRPGLGPVGLSRKVCHFSNLAVAWAGRYDAAKAMISHLFKETQGNGPICPDELPHVCSNLAPWIRKTIEDRELAFLGYLVDPAGKNDLGFGAHWTDETSSTLDDLRIAGSGSETFRQYFDHHTPLEFEFIVGAEAIGFEAAACTALAFTGMLLQLEVGTHENLLHAFGGGYELISVKDHQFILCDDLMSMFLFAQVDDEGITLNPYMKFFKQNYHGDVLILRTLEMRSPDPSNPLFLMEREDDIHFLPPVYRELTTQEMSDIPKPDLNAFMLCTYILVQSKAGIEVLTKFDFSKRRELPLRFVDDGTHMTMQFQKTHVEDILNAVAARTRTFGEQC